MVKACATCQYHLPQEPRQLLKPTPGPEHPWQHCGADFMFFNGYQYFIVKNYCLKMPIIHKMLPSQCTDTKMILTVKELFAKHGIPEMVWSDNSLQFASALFA